MSSRHDHTTTVVYTGRRITLALEQVRFPDGSSGELEIVRHPGAAAVIPFLDPPDDPDPRILLLQQHRHAADGSLWEIPAGTLDDGEDPTICARRELEEEAGAMAHHLEQLTTIFTTPGFTDEQIHLFRAWDLTRVDARPERDEFITVHETRWSTVLRMASTGEIQDGKSLVALLYAEAFRRHRQPDTPVRA